MAPLIRETLASGHYGDEIEVLQFYCMYPQEYLSSIFHVNIFRLNLKTRDTKELRFLVRQQ